MVIEFLQQKILHKCDFLYDDSTYNKLEDNLLNDIKNFKDKKTDTPT